MRESDWSSDVCSSDLAEQQEEPAADQPPPGVKMSRQEAERLLQKIRDAEKARRELLRQRERARHKPVDRDW
jgi:hypothetical protein